MPRLLLLLLVLEDITLHLGLQSVNLDFKTAQFMSVLGLFVLGAGQLLGDVVSVCGDGGLIGLGLLEG